MGGSYVELSLSDIVDTERMRLIHEHFPSIEADTGVRLRFLGAMHRLDDYEWDLDYIIQLQRLVKSPYVVGVDFMGHETTSTRQIERQIRGVAQWAHEHRPGFVVRIHAGENPGHPENVRLAIDCVEGFDVILRIGHGLYGVDDSTMERIKSMEAIVEFNLNSNFVLNNIQSALEVPMERYLDAGVPVVLGTDGYGIYHTSLADETRSALLLGASLLDIEAIRSNELKYMERRDESDLSTNRYLPIPESPPHQHFTPEIARAHEASRNLRDERLKNRLETLALPSMQLDEFVDKAKGLQTICIAGAWRHSWSRMESAHQDRIREFLKTLIEQLDASQFQLVTGGTHLGVEGEVAELAKLHGIPHFGAIVRESPPSDISHLLNGIVIVGETLWEKSHSLYQCMVACDALCLFIGGGNIVNDEIQVARNLRARYLLMAEVEGASSTHAEHLPNRAFRKAEEVLSILLRDHTDSPPEPYWHMGPNPMVDLVLIRRGPSHRKQEILLIRRDVDAVVEAGSWALPGGFQLTDAPRGTPWEPGKETLEDACLREAMEETGLDIRPLKESLRFVGVYTGGGRDPRDTKEAWGVTNAFLMYLPEAEASLPILGGDDACEALWFAIDDLPPQLAFDHHRILRDALKIEPAKY